MLKSLRFLMRLTLPAAPGYRLWLAVSVLSAGLAPLVNVYVPKLMLDELLGAKRLSFLILCVGVLAGLNLIFNLLKALSRTRLSLGTVRMYDQMIERIGFKAMQLSYAQGEKKSTLDLLERANYGSYALSELDQRLSQAGGALISLVGSLAMILTYDWRLIFLTLIPSLLALPCFRRIKDLKEEDARRGVPENRAFRYFLSVAGDYRWAKDLRLYKGQGLMLGRATAVMDKILSINHSFFTKSGFWNGAVRVLIEGQTMLIFILLGLALAAGRITAGVFTLLYGACRQLGEAINTLLRVGTELITVDMHLRPLQEVMALPEVEMFVPEELPDDVAQALAQACEGRMDFAIRNLVFQYPTGDKPVLNGLDMDINTGETLAIVGRNGAGKSTLVKLLCRLYAPASGVITLNGVDISRIPLPLYYRLLAPAFQDFKLLPFRLSEALSGKAASRLAQAEEETLRQALIQVGMGEWLDDQAQGLDSFFTKSLDEKGIVPSGGQEQKLALARSVARQGRFLMMDEPTAALDPRSEEEVFCRMLSITRGQTALYISHRLSSTRFADRILVMDEGKIAQEGSHHQLMAQAGLYCRMFTAQAQQYQTQ
ncbi:MAG: ABC transporter ATP-binding protein [Christensenellales bacterium]|jgi:ATP-binding cassette subfamily B protein